jgi:hypothetical protein
MVQGSSRPFQNRLEVFHYSFGVLPDIAVNQLASRRIQGNLARQKEEVAGPDSLGIGPHRCRSPLGINGFLFHHHPPCLIVANGY